MPIKLKCKECKKEYLIPPNRLARSKFCSMKCVYNFYRIEKDPRVPKGAHCKTWETYQKMLRRHREWHHRTYKKLSKEEYAKAMIRLPEYLRKLRYHERLKKQLFEKLGSRCRKCGIKDIRVLQIDHIHGGGNNDRKAAGKGKIGGTYLYRLILRGLRPIKNYQILCANCNWIKRFENKNERGGNQVKP